MAENSPWIERNSRLNRIDCSNAYIKRHELKSDAWTVDPCSLPLLQAPRRERGDGLPNGHARSRPAGNLPAIFFGHVRCLRLHERAEVHHCEFRSIVITDSV